jgi:transposase
LWSLVRVLRLETINDLDQMRQVAQLLEAENRRLHERLATLIQELAAFKGKSGSESLQLELLKRQEQMAALSQRMFGRSSEKQPHSSQTDEKEALPRRGHGPKEQPALLIVEKRHELLESERTCLVCSGQLLPMGEQTEDSEEITVVQRQFVRVLHKRQKYRCRCNAAIATAPGPLKLIPGGRYSLEFAVEVAVQKYAYHLPLERLCKMMRHEGLLVDSQTLWDQIEALCRVLGPTYALIRAHILSAEVLHADETRWMLLKKGGSKQWHAWAFSTEDAVYYHIDPSRSAQVPVELLRGFLGVVMADGYICYQTLARGSPGLVLAHCMAHCRRKFVEALPAYPQCQTAVDFIKDLYMVERGLPSLKGHVGEEREQALKLRMDVRKKESALLMEKLHAWALEQSALPDSLLYKAISYMLNLWPGLVRFIDDPRIPIDNNVVERDLRGVVVGRKNHYGSKSLRGTQVAATFYTLVETASRCGADPRQYLLAAARHALQSQGTALLPWQLSPA